MEDLVMAGPLKAAFAEKGYETLTSVQEAVLVPEAAGRDLLVSAQTGSGKTVAFGLAIAPEVLGGVDRLLPAEAPIALVIAPTRELALQVKREFEWLYAAAGVQLASCVGGMDYRTERRALERGAHIVVGTPGRLRDHVERGSLNLSALKAAVLDEADEMLDLGFSEDLEFLLGAAPAEKRVLMFSATVPKEIEALARTYQRDALRIVAQGESRQHSDIEYQAVNVANRDKEPAIFNLLRYHEAQTAIVFAKTRANVNHLFARMVNRGFQVVALSGELSQSERMHALQALRDGRARVCIATDVAARGIDLPGLELVIHADLPTNSETLLHRSGRTGRAGRKGLSVLVVPTAEFRKANRLLQGAKVEATWGKAPTAEEVQSREDERLMADTVLAAPTADEEGIVETILATHTPEALAAGFLRLWRKGRAAPEVLSDEPMPAAPPPARPRGEFGPSVWYRLSVGHTGRAEARWLLPKVCDAGSIAKDAIGAIRVQQDVTFIQIAEPAAPRFGAMKEIEPGLTMERIEGDPDLGRPERTERRVGTRPEARPERSTERRSPRPDSRPERSEEPREKAPYRPKPAHIVEEDAPAESSGEVARRTWPRREGGAEGPRPPRPEGAPRKPFAPRGEEGGAPRPKYDRADRQGGSDDRRPYAPRSPRPYADGDAPKKPRWTPDDRAERTDRSEKGDRPYTPRGPRPEGAPSKPAYKSTGFKSHGGSPDRPARASGYKSHSAEGAPKGPRRSAEGDSRPPREAREGWTPRAPREGDRTTDAPRKPGAKPYGAKPTGPRSEGKSWGAKSHGAAGSSSGGYKGKSAPLGDRTPTKRPAAPKADASDTSKRFIPPKKPRT